MTNAIKALLQMTSVSLQPVPSLGIVNFFYKQSLMSKLNKKPLCTTLKCAHMDQLYNNLTPNHS
jgi:hypothetical protein